MSAPVDVTPDNFDAEVMKSDKPVLIDFWAPWCAPCKMIAPLLDKVSDERDDVKIVKVNMDEHPEIGAQFLVRGLPTMVVTKAGTQAGMKVGAVNRKQLDEFIDSAV